jgi:DNA polymerase
MPIDTQLKAEARQFLKDHPVTPAELERALNAPPVRGPVASIDFETRSTVDLTKCGADVYAAGEHTGIWCLAWALDDDPVSIWYPNAPTPNKLLDHIEGGGTVAGWNLHFELAIWLPKYVDWPELRAEQCDDTMARALARSLPGKLEEAAKAFRLEIQKDKVGWGIMRKMCVPTKEWRKNPIGLPQWHNDPQDRKRLFAYCKQDVEVERALAKRLAPLTASERKVWQLDRTINQRGVRVDVDKIKTLLPVAESEAARLTKELQQITKKQVRTAKSHKAMLRWLASRGVELPDLKKRKLNRLLKSDRVLPLDVRRVLEIRLEINKASIAKLTAMIVSRNADDRCRGLFGYHRATTGRFGSYRLQLHNLMRPDMKQWMIDHTLELFGEEWGRDFIQAAYSTDLINAIANCMRAMIIPAERKRFVGGDYTGIENRILMWFSQEEWELENFRKLDAGCGVDAYKLAYSMAFNVPIETVTSAQRLIGKVMVLACGYSGAVGAILGMGDNYDNFKPGEVAQVAKATCDPYIWKDTLARYPKDPKWQFNLDADTWTGIRVVVDAWRSAHPLTKQLWWSLVDAAIEAVERKGDVATCAGGKLKFKSNGHFLFCQLPSGRALAYAKPHLVTDKSGRQSLWYFGQGKKSKKWERREFKPSIIAENAVSGTARDVLTEGMLRLEAAGYPISLHVHDEAVAEMPFGVGSPEEFKAILCNVSPWLAGCPIAAHTWEGPTFRK